MTRKLQASCIIHAMLACASTWGILRGLPQDRWAGWYVSCGFALAAVAYLFGQWWEWRAQPWMHRNVTFWWDRWGDMEAALAFPVGSLLGTVAFFLWR